MKRSGIINWFVGSFLVPPVTWLLASWYYNLWNTEEISAIAGKLNEHAGHLSKLVDKFEM